MLALTGGLKDLERGGFIYEPKLDGTRALCHVDSDIRLVNRRGRDITYRYPELAFRDRISAGSCVLDGEIVVYDAKGNPSFSLLQKREHLEGRARIDLRSVKYPAVYVVFDILEIDGKDVTEKPLTERKTILEETVKENESIEIIFYTADGPVLWKEIERRGVEGVMAKDASGRYHPGERSGGWLKIKTLNTLDCVIVGYTAERRVISALALAVCGGDGWRYVGTVGTGFTEEFLADLRTKLDGMRIKAPPVKYAGPKDIRWVMPRLVCEVEYLELSKDGIMRAPVFLRMRDDKAPEECVPS